MSTPSLREWLQAGPFGLVMSSGFFSFYAHTGLCDALDAAGITPAHVAGSSAGALVSGAWASGLAPARLAEELERLTRGDFWDPGVGAGLLAGKKFDALLRRMLPATTFERCAVPVRVSVFDILGWRTRVLERGDLVHAIRASCAVPGMFQPVWIEGRPYWDGGVYDRPGLEGVPPGRVLYHHIAGQSPWRSAPPPIPARADMVTVVIPSLPRANPFRLDAGRQALAAARAAMVRALDRPVATVLTV